MAHIAAFAAGVLGAMGLGGGGLLLLWLVASGIGQRAAQGINLVFILPVGLLGLWLHRREGLADLKTAFSVLPGAVGGLALGLFVAGRIPERLLSVLFGGFICVIGVREIICGLRLLRKRRRGD